MPFPELSTPSCSFQPQDQGAAPVTQSTYDGTNLGEASLDPGHLSYFGGFPWFHGPTYQASNNVGFPGNAFPQQPWNNQLETGFHYSSNAQMTAAALNLHWNVSGYLADPLGSGLNTHMPAVAQVPTNLEHTLTLPAFHIPHQVTPQEPSEDRISCPKGCTATFGRPGEFRRHMRKHEKPRYKCCVLDCEKTFARADKLRDHLRQGHKLKLG